MDCKDFYTRYQVEMALPGFLALTSLALASAGDATSDPGRCKTLKQVADAWLEAVEELHGGTDLGYKMCIPALAVAGAESWDTPYCHQSFDSQIGSDTKGLWQMSHPDYPTNHDMKKQGVWLCNIPCDTAARLLMFALCVGSKNRVRKLHQ